MPFLNFTTSLGTSNSVYYNTSYIIANQPPGMTTPTVWMFFIAIGISALLISRISTEPTAKDLAGIIAAPILLVSAIQAFAVDVVTGTVYTAGTDAPYLGAILQTHTIYHYDLMAVVLGILFIISLANLYLLWVEPKRLVAEEQPRPDLSMGSYRKPRAAPRDEEDDEED